jgi:hypothetical protein
VGHIIDCFGGLRSFLRPFRVSTALIAQHSAQHFLFWFRARADLCLQAALSVDGRSHLIATNLAHAVAA